MNFLCRLLLNRFYDMQQGKGEFKPKVGIIVLCTEVVRALPLGSYTVVVFPNYKWHNALYSTSSTGSFFGSTFSWCLIY